MRIPVVLFCLLAKSLTAQDSKTGNWLIYFGNQPLTTKLNIWNEVQYRNYNAIGDLQQLLLRTGIGYNLTPNNNNLLVGYGYILGETYINKTQKNSTSEHRIFQQFLTKQNILNNQITHRYRIEQRFLVSEFNLRFRYFLAINIPLNKKELNKNCVYLSAYNEIFIQNNGNYFDRNRIYGALGYYFMDQLKLEIGFMNQTTLKESRNQFQIALFNQIPLKNSR